VNNKNFLVVRLFCFALLGVLCASSFASAQEEGEPVVVDEVIAQVNNDIVTLSMLRREMREAAEVLRQTQRTMTPEQATAEIAKRQPEIIASLINEQLLLQRAKELNLTNEVEAEVNRRMLAVAKEQGISTLEALDQALRQSGLNPVEVRRTLRTEITKEYVLGGEVDQRLLYGLSTEEVKKYYDQNQARFRQPETIELSEIFLSLAGKPEAEVKARAQALVQQARAANANFGELAAANSERTDNAGARTGAQTKGKVGAFQVQDLRTDIAAALKNVQSGQTSDPLRTDEGYIIFRVDKRTASGGASFDDRKVREAIVLERRGAERTKYLRKLRGEAYVKIADNYRASVEPILNAAATPETTTTPAGTTTGGR